jgi:hypothetical protein
MLRHPGCKQGDGQGAEWRQQASRHDGPADQWRPAPLAIGAAPGELKRGKRSERGDKHGIEIESSRQAAGNRRKPAICHLLPHLALPTFDAAQSKPLVFCSGSDPANPENIALR